MKTMGSKSLQALAMLAVAADLDRHSDAEHRAAEVRQKILMEE